MLHTPRMSRRAPRPTKRLVRRETKNLIMECSSRHHIPPGLHAPQQPITGHRLHGRPQTLVDAEQLARLHRAEAFGMLLEQRDNAPAHVAAGRTRYDWRS